MPQGSPWSAAFGSQWRDSGSVQQYDAAALESCSVPAGCEVTFSRPTFPLLASRPAARDGHP